MIDRVARRFRAMGEPQRLRILQVLEDGPRSAGEPVATLKGNQPNISRHLQALYDAGLVRRRRERNNIYYAIADPGGPPTLRAGLQQRRARGGSGTGRPPRGWQRKCNDNGELKEDRMEVFINHLGAMQFDIQARRHSTVCDQPTEDGGFDEGMTPPEFLLAALGSCAAFYAAQYLRKNGIAKEGTTVRVTAEKLLNPPRLDNFHIEIDAPVVLSAQHKAGVEATVQHCLIHNTLRHPPKIELDVRTSSPSGHMPVAT